MPAKNQGKIIPLKKFDMGRINLSKTTVFVGKRGSGKSTAIKDLLYHVKQAPVAVAFSSTDIYTHFYKSIIHQNFIHHDYDDDAVSDIIKRQSQMIIRNNKLEEKGEKKKKAGLVVIMDDMMADAKSIFKTKNVKHLFFNGRHISVLLIVASQYAILLPRELRSNIDFSFLCRETNAGNKRRLYDDFSNIFETYDDFKATFDHYTQNYGILVVDNTAQGSRVEDCVFQYTAKIRDEPFKIGHHPPAEDG